MEALNSRLLSGTATQACQARRQGKRECIYDALDLRLLEVGGHVPGAFLHAHGIRRAVDANTLGLDVHPV